MKILVTNSVPLNGGDEALLLALIGTVQDALPDARFTVLTNATGLARKVLPDLQLDDDLECAVAERARDALDALRGSTDSPARRAAAGAARRVVEFGCAKSGRRRIFEHYRSADAVFSAPGGYLHDHYPLQARLRGLETAIELGKPVMLVGHSLGPFWKPASIVGVARVLNRATRIVVRDRFSLEHLRECGVRGEHVSIAADLAFAWASLAPGLYRRHAGRPRRLGLCFRRWPLRDRSGARAICRKATELCGWLLRDPSVELVFTSTCQGVPGYVDDSLLADAIVAGLPAPMRSRCVVDRARRSTRDTISFLGSLDVCVSMRMHVCVLAMLGGTPAMALDYETKSVGVYEMMRLDDHHLDFRRDAREWIDAVGRFLDASVELCATLDGRVSAMAHSAGEGIRAALRDAGLVAR